MLSSGQDNGKAALARGDTGKGRHQENNRQNAEFSYKPLLKLIIQEEYCPFTKGSLGISWKKGTYFCFDTDKYTPAMGAVEILTSEYNELTKSAKGE